MAKSFKESLYLHNENQECDIIAAGSSDPLFGDVAPDQYTAYSRIRFGKSLPLVAGPESISGAVFGMHPAVIARSFMGIRHKQMNIGHKVHYLTGKEDRICGCVLDAAFPDEPEGGWVIPASVEEAPSITAFAALFKQAKGVDKMLGDHLTGKVVMAVSMEFSFFWEQVGLFVPDEGKIYERNAIPRALQGYVYEDNKGRLGIRKSGRKPELVLAIGGNNGRIIFSGVGYTNTPAESTAEVESIAAQQREGMLVCGAAANELKIWAPGMPVKWKGGHYGRGTIAAVTMEGSRTMWNKTLQGTPENPVLEIILPNRVSIIRSADSLEKI